jgi:hypothetical protein
MLDERGVEYETDDAQVSDTEWYYVTKLRDGYHDRWIYEEPPDCDLLVSYQYDLGAEDAIAATLGATDAKPTQAESSGTCHTARRVIVADPATDCATGFCTCGNCGNPIDPWDAWCRHCGAELEDA